MKTFALSGYPLSQRFAELLEESVGTRPRYFTLSQFRALPLRDLIAVMWSIRGQRCIVALEDDTTGALLPLIAGLALLAFPKSMEVLRPDLSRQPLRRRDVIRSMVALARASLVALRAVRSARAEIHYLETTAPKRHSVSGRQRRALYVNANLWFGIKAGGSVGHVAGVVNALVDAGYDVDLATAPEPVMIRPQARVIRLQPAGPLGVPLEYNYYSFQREVVRQLRQAVKTESYAFIYHRMSVANFVGVVLARDFDLPLVAEYNGSEVWAARNWGRSLRLQDLAERAEDVSFRHAAHVVVVSEPLVRELRARGVDPERIVYHPNGVDARIFDPARFSREDRRSIRSKYGIEEDAVVATFVGTFGRWHGVDLLARVVAKMCERDARWLDRERVQFLFVGDGGKMPEVRRLLSGAAQRYSHFTGLVPQDEAPAHLACSDILLSPHVPNPDGSEFFGSPTKIFEYMAMAKGIVASRLGQIGTVLSPALDVSKLPDAAPAPAGDSVAVLMEPGSEEQLRDGVRFLVEQQRWRRHLGENARRHVLGRYTWAHHVQAILDRVEGRD